MNRFLSLLWRQGWIGVVLIISPALAQAQTDSLWHDQHTPSLSVLKPLSPVLVEGNVLQLLQSRVPGLSIVRHSGQPGTAVSALMRGIDNIRSANDAPLVVVDGVVLGTDARDLSVFDVAQFRVLRGAEATMAYGTQGYGGVIEIETHHGQQAEGAQLRIRNQLGWTQMDPRARLRKNEHHWYQVENGQFIDFNGDPTPYGAAIQLDEEPWAEDIAFSDNPYPLDTPLYDHHDQFFRVGQVMTNAIELSQRGARSRLYLSLRNHHDTGVVFHWDGYHRQSGRLAFEQDLSAYVKVRANAFYVHTTHDESYGETFFPLQFLSPVGDLTRRYANGNLVIQPDPLAVETNPLRSIEESDEFEAVDHLTGQVELSAKPTAWIHLHTRLGYKNKHWRKDQFFDKYHGREYTGLPYGGQSTLDASQKLQTTYTIGRYIINQSQDQRLHVHARISLTPRLNNTRFWATVQARLNWHRNRTVYIQGDDLTILGLKDFSNVEGSIQGSSGLHPILSEGYWIDMGLEHRQTYRLGLSLYREGNSTFGRHQRWQSFYRLSADYHLSRETWWPWSQVSDLSLHYGYASVGGRPPFDAQYETYWLSNGSVGKWHLANPDIKPERLREHTAGLRLRLWDRLGLGLHYIHGTTTDMLLIHALPGYVGFASQWVNSGALRSHTWEAYLQADLFHTPDFTWATDLVFDRSRSRITDVTLPNGLVYELNHNFGIRRDDDVRTIYGIKWVNARSELPAWTQAYPDHFQVNDDGYLVAVGAGNSWQDGIRKQLWGSQVDVDGNGTGDYPWGMPIALESERLVALGTLRPDFSLGWAHRFRYKHFAAHVLLGAEIGGHIYNFTKQWSYRDGHNVDQDQGHKPDTHKKPISYYEQLYQATGQTSHFLEDGTYVKVRELSVSYTFDQRQLGRFLGQGVQYIRVGVAGHNLLTFSGYSGFDPEVGTATFRYDNFGYPNYRRLVGSLDIGF